jgi:hypothetical protein
MRVILRQPPTGEAKAGLDILRLQIRQFQQDLFGGQSAGQEIKNVRYADSHPANTGAPSALFGIDRDSLRQIHHAPGDLDVEYQPRRAFRAFAGTRLFGARFGKTRCFILPIEMVRPAENSARPAR